MVELRHGPNPIARKRQRRKVGERLPPLGLKALPPEKRLLKPRPRKMVKEWAPEIVSDLQPTIPVTDAELDAILQLLGDDLQSILG